MSREMIAEFIGTLTLVLFGCGTAMAIGAGADNIAGVVGISFAFGLALIGMAYGIGPISGCHINPAVSLGAMLAGRMTTAQMIRYWIAQIAGACAGALLLLIIFGKVGGTNGWGEGYLGEYGLVSAFVFELVATFLFLVVILGSTSNNAGAGGAHAGLAIGLALVVIHLFGIMITGVSVNPARSIGPAIFSGSGQALAQLWLFIVAPALGAAAAGLLFKMGLLGDETVSAG